MIKIDNLSVDLGGKPIVENISVTIQNNCNTMLVGKSGSGKSVLMKAAIGLFPAKQGEIHIDGQLINKLKQRELSKIRTNIGYLFQNAALFDSMNVYQNVAFPLFEHKKYSTEREIINKVKQTLEAVQLDDVMMKMPADLSGGMRKRVGLARSIIMNPKYIIYDEPTTGLDPVTGSEIIDLIGSLQKELQMTSIIITHDIECVERLAEDIIMLENRNLVFAGTYNDFKQSELASVQQYLSFF
ncbi:MAG TPA: ATP-binding cassette domain-containing protein [Candidatus Cloacimonadota bacterium]|nr:ATP-binding cassette domain-containing protein [Candidatus Cloacimonadota bacterium]HOQ79663.1 ATP-binding cassette domain-containing protein [Candidatus Cloacimonadota bacterium]HPK40936.1 ATP-binding cassette domain-containing protein [Candidatus Cloacimonadota bacterium]